MARNPGPQRPPGLRIQSLASGQRAVSEKAGVKKNPQILEQDLKLSGGPGQGTQRPLPFFFPIRRIATTITHTDLQV